MYTYKTVAAPSNLSVKHQYDTNMAIATFGELINRECAGGWEFYSLESMVVSSNPGCLGMLFKGGKQMQISINMLVFRKRVRV